MLCTVWDHRGADVSPSWLTGAAPSPRWHDIINASGRRWLHDEVAGRRAGSAAKSVHSKVRVFRGRNATLYWFSKVYPSLKMVPITSCRATHAPANGGSASGAMYKMRSFQQSIATFTDNVANVAVQFCELKQLRERLTRAQQSARRSRSPDRRRRMRIQTNGRLSWRPHL
jgi:hypothetical protein